MSFQVRTSYALVADLGSYEQIDPFLSGAKVAPLFLSVYIITGSCHWNTNPFKQGLEGVEDPLLQYFDLD